MTKYRGDCAYVGEEDGDMFDKGKDYQKSKEIEDFCKNTLNKTFANWILVGRDFDSRNFKEIEGGHLMSGIVMMNLNSPEDEKKQQSGSIKNLDGKSRLAMMVLDAVEGVCEDENETENFLEALLSTAKHNHAEDAAEDDEEGTISIERTKIRILKGLLDSAIESFDEYDDKEKFIRSCISSVIPARILSRGDTKTKQKLRRSMRAAVSGDESGGEFANKAVGSIDNWVTTLLDAIDDGKSPAEIEKILKTFNENI